MNDDAVALRRGDILIWTIVAAVALVVLLVALLFDFRLLWASFLPVAVGGGGLAVAQLVYTRWRPDPPLAAALGGTAQIVAFAAVGAPLSYLGAALALPLQDHLFVAADRMLGFDWLALLAWMNTHAALHPLFRELYLSLLPQTIVVVLALAYSGRLAWLRVFVLSFVFAALTTIAIAAFLPAEGVWGFYGLTASNHPQIVPATREAHLAIFHGLRDGSFRLLMARGAEGIITFPSLHSALAVLLVAGLWPLPFLRWFGVALNAVMLVSIPVDGGHYFIDVVAGIVVAAVSLAAANAIMAPRRTPRPGFVQAFSAVWVVPGSGGAKRPVHGSAD